MEAIIRELKQKAVPILKEAGIVRTSLFGSYIRGEQTETSDIDLLVEYPEGLTLFDIAEIKYKLEDVLGKKVDLVDMKKVKPRLKSSIFSQQQTIL